MLKHKHNNTIFVVDMMIFCCFFAFMYKVAVKLQILLHVSFLYNPSLFTHSWLFVVSTLRRSQTQKCMFKLKNFRLENGR